MNWLYYLLEANLYLGVFYLAYALFLSKETWYTLNRAYLLLSCVVSFILPLVQLGILKPAVHAVTVANYTVVGQPIVLSMVKEVPVAYQFTWQDGVFYAYLLGAAVLLLMLLLKLYQLFKLAQSNKNQPDSRYKLVYLKDTNTAFSFFNFLFIGTNAGGEETIIRHELVHIRQKHSADIIFLELLKIINWFNPFIYLLQISLRAVHEYIADEKTATADTDTLAYSAFLVNNAYGLSGPTITHSFFNYNLLKKRIIMLHQQRSGTLARLKYLMAVPICAASVCASTLAFSKSYSVIDLFPQKPDTAHIAPPPPPAPPLVDVKLLPPPPPAPPKPRAVYGYTKKGYKYRVRKYASNGLANYEVFIYEKNGDHHLYVSNSTSAVERTALNEKYGYIFPADGKFGIIKSVVKFPPPVVTSVTVSGTDMHKLPPPPPPAPPAKIVDMRPPPPPPFDPAYKDLFEYLGKHVLYPATAFENKETGTVVVKFNLNSDHKITDVQLVSGSGNAFDDEVIRVVKAFPGTITSSGNHPYYLTGVSFSLISNKGNKMAKDFDKDFTASENYTCVSSIYGFMKGN